MTPTASSTAGATTAASELPERGRPARFQLNVPSAATLRHCIHCGLCLGACPSYRVLGTEGDSPRGRLYLLRALHEGRLPSDLAPGLNADVERHLDLCLGCRACESACPSGVRFGDVLESARATFRHARRTHLPTARASALDWFTRVIVSNRPLLAASALGCWVMHELHIPQWARSGKTPRWLSPRLTDLVAKTPRPLGPPFHLRAQPVYPAFEEKRARVAFFTGCIMDAVMGDLHRQTIEVLQQQGVEVMVPRQQTCCGALHAHAGDEEHARLLARRNLDALRGETFDAFVNNSAGCGAQIREWGRLLADEPQYAAEAAALSAKTFDVTRFLVNLGLRPFPHRLYHTAAYDAPCHLLHVQREAEAPLLLLQQITGLRVNPLPDAEHCCGAAGFYTLSQPEMAAKVLAPKIAYLTKTHPDYLITGNPGCLLQFQHAIAQAGLEIKVVHPLYLAWLSYH